MTYANHDAGDVDERNFIGLSHESHAFLVIGVENNNSFGSKFMGIENFNAETAASSSQNRNHRAL